MCLCTNHSIFKFKIRLYLITKHLQEKQKALRKKWNIFILSLQAAKYKSRCTTRALLSQEHPEQSEQKLKSQRIIENNKEGLLVPSKQFTRKHPMNAKLRRDEETIEDFFYKHLKFYDKNGLNQMPLPILSDHNTSRQ